MDTLTASCGRRNVQDIVEIVVAAVRYVLQGIRWNHAFADNGLAGDMQRTSKYIRNQLEWKELPAILASPPDVAILQKAWPVSRRLPLAEIFESLGLEAPAAMSEPLGLAPADSMLAPSDDEAQVDDMDLFMDDPIASVPPLSDDDMPIRPS